MKISIFGMGYVGCVTSACFAKEGHEVIGVDIDPVKVEMITNGQSPIIEDNIEEFIREQSSSGKLKATLSTEDAIRQSDISIICVGTPSKANGSLNLDYVVRCVKDISKCISKKSSYHLVVVRSTVLPGSTEGVILDALNEAENKQVGKDIGLTFHPEFLREGSSISDFYNAPFTIIGEYDKKAGDALEQVYSFLATPIIRTDIKSAEMIKYVCNAFHALKVSFANEIGNICKKVGCDSHTVMDIFCEDKKLNLSSYYLKPGFAYGGSCLPKDLKALVYQSTQLDLNPVLIKAISESNNKQVEIGISMIMETRKRNVGVLGFSFKEGTDDLRESPTVELIERILGKGCQLKLYDKNVSMAKLFGANKRFIEKEIPHISSLITTDIKEVIDSSDVIVIGHKSDEFVPYLRNLSKDKIVIDLVRLVTPETCEPAKYKGICW